MKKTEFISFRCSEKVKSLIEADSIEKEWTISHTVEKILTEYYERKNGRSKADCTKYTFLYKSKKELHHACSISVTLFIIFLQQPT